MARCYSNLRVFVEKRLNLHWMPVPRVILGLNVRQTPQIHIAPACHILSQLDNTRLTYSDSCMWLCGSAHFKGARPMSTFSELISPNCIKVGESRGRSSLFSKFVLASTLLYFEIRATYRRLGSKMEAKFRTFSPINQSINKTLLKLWQNAKWQMILSA